MTQPNKPSWEDAPKRAQYLAQDQNGEWFWYDQRPMQCHTLTAWISGDGRFRIATHGAVIDDWRDTLEQRPQKDEPMTEHLTANDIDVLIHCHVNPEPHPHRNAPAVASALRLFKERGIIEPLDYEETRYRTTDKGKKWVEMLCATPEPVQQWADPREDDDD